MVAQYSLSDGQCCLLDEPYQRKTGCSCTSRGMAYVTNKLRQDKSELAREIKYFTSSLQNLLSEEDPYPEGKVTVVTKIFIYREFQHFY